MSESAATGSVVDVRYAGGPAPQPNHHAQRSSTEGASSIAIMAEQLQFLAPNGPPSQEQLPAQTLSGFATFVIVLVVVVVSIMVLGCVRTCVQGSHSATKLKAAFERDVALLNSGGSGGSNNLATGSKGVGGDARTRSAVASSSLARNTAEARADMSAATSTTVGYVGPGQGPSPSSGRRASPIRRSQAMSGVAGSADACGTVIKARVSSGSASHTHGDSTSADNVHAAAAAHEFGDGDAIDDDHGSDLTDTQASHTFDEHRSILHSSIFSNLDELESESSSDEDGEGPALALTAPYDGGVGGGGETADGRMYDLQPATTTPTARTPKLKLSSVVKQLSLIHI